ncbi:hypothetical protein BBF96_11055 [Anoxybacter fermentans]|uniref:Flagellar assembly protein FliH/Type III secretion system HrpE domain-containing protein n=1 Tax=Anoxybacter fermentans TaxID=1323375 RepID=A0A3S9T021_9FIRM|nr:FliH/SctL family protein [Anoxybacter fermentans]AZR73879.1 hypothetical protein BBF96_11055 [Anoxybacter fermentans]
MSKIIKAEWIRQEDKLRQLFVEKTEKKEDIDSKEPEILKLKEEAEKEAALIIEQARKEAEKLLSQSEAEIQEMMETGYNEGYKQGVEEGYRAGMEQILNEMGKLIQNLQKEIERTQMIMESKVQGLSSRLIRLSIQIAERIIRRQVELNPEIIIEQVESILKDMMRVKSLVIRVNPSQFEIVKGAQDRFLALTHGIDEIEFVIDHSLKPGDCIIETDSGGVDASIETQLEMITSLLLEGSGDEDA